MCIGVPMQVLRADEFQALCADGDRTASVDTSLVGQPAPGTWLLVFLGAAREVLDPDTAREMRSAVEAVGRIMSGNHQVDHLFADLIGREPQLPEHLRPPDSKPGPEPGPERGSGHGTEHTTESRRGGIDPCPQS